MSLTPQEETRLSTDNGSGPHVDYLVRRETHSSRALSAVVLAILGILVCAYLATEGILQMAGKKPLLARPTDIWHAVTDLPEHNMALAIVIGVVLTIIGLVFLAKALAPGALGRHSIKDKRAAYIIDDSVVASALSRRLREHANLSDGQVRTSVSTRSIDVEAKPTSGLTLDEHELATFANSTVESYNLDPAPRTQFRISEEGQVAK
ncbi:MAG: hypothetical protein Q4B10_03790 [Actinomycetaceae bacterium]|nr:hypothetical protein [Actinomycetaceae bacterium]